MLNKELLLCSSSRVGINAQIEVSVSQSFVGFVRQLSDEFGWVNAFPVYGNPQAPRNSLVIVGVYYSYELNKTRICNYEYYAFPLPQSVTVTTSEGFTTTATWPIGDYSFATIKGDVLHLFRTTANSSRPLTFYFDPPPDGYLDSQTFKPI